MSTLWSLAKTQAKGRRKLKIGKHASQMTWTHWPEYLMLLCLQDTLFLTAKTFGEQTILT